MTKADDDDDDYDNETALTMRVYLLTCLKNIKKNGRN